MTATNFYDFLNELLSDHEKVLVLPALRQDPLIFKGLQDVKAVENLESVRETLKGRLTPGVLALGAIHPNLLDAVLKAEKLPTAFLESIFATYEDFKQNSTRCDQLEKAVNLALALIEKRRIVSHWKLVLNDLFKGKSPQNEPCNLWQTAILIASQLDSHREEILEVLAQPGGSPFQQGIFIHCVLAQPMTREEKTQQLVSAFSNHNEAVQVRVLDEIQTRAGQNIAEGTAKGLLANAINVQANNPSTSEVWANPADYLRQASRFHNLSSIALIAGDNERALQLVESAGRIVGQYKTGLEIQKIGSIRGDDQKEQRASDALKILQENPEDADVLSELMMAIDPCEDGTVLSAVAESSNLAVDLAKAGSMDLAGNTALARETLAQALANRSSELSHLSPRFSRRLTLEKVFDALVHFNLPEEAANIARQMLSRNPGDVALVQKSAPVFFAAGDFRNALELYQSLETLQPAAIEVKRAKALIHEKLGEDAQAFQSWNAVIKLSESAMDDDLLHLANTANRLGDSRGAIEAASAIPEGSDYYGKALIAMGNANRQSGDRHQAIQYFAKAIETEVDDEEPWLALADLYSTSGEQDRSVDTLKAARSVFPDSQEIPFELAKRLVDKDSPSEALTVLSDLTHRNPEFIPAQVMTIKTMKALHHEGVESRIDELSSRFPNSPEIAYFKALEYLEDGFKKEAAGLLSKAVNAESPEPEWLAAYADALAGENYHKVHFAENKSEKDLATAKQILDRSGLVNTDPLAASVQAEMFLDQGNASEAFNVISEVISKQVSPESEWFWRLQAGLARAATLMGKFDIALAAIEDAITAKPGMAGLHQIVADVHKASGDTLSALDAANRVLAIAPEVVENVLWFTNFLTGLGRSDEAEKELQKVIARKPEEIKYRLALGNLLHQAGRENEIKHILGSVESLKKTNLEDEDFINAANLYFKAGDLESTAFLLEERATRDPGSIQARLDWAAILARGNRSGEAIQALENGTTDGMPVFNLVKAQIHYDLSNISEAANDLAKLPGTGSIAIGEFNTPFAPNSWDLLFHQTKPDTFLNLKVRFALGEFQSAADLAKESLEEAPGDGWSKFMLEQSALALGKDEEPDKAASPLGLPGIIAYTHAQRLLDASETGKALRVLDEISTDLDEEWEAAIRTQAAAIKGELIESEVNAGKLEISKYTGVNTVKAEEVVKVRSLILANLGRWSWNDTLAAGSSLYHSAAGNKANAALFLKVIVTMLENHGNNLGLEIKNHAPSLDSLANARQFIPELQTLLADVQSTEMRRWVLRSHLILDPNAANVRALAMIPPQVDDITAMMGALHSMGDDTTAVQTARKVESHPQVLAQLARCYESSDVAKALAALSRSLQINEAQPAVWVARSILEERQGGKENAIQSMENALSYWPEEIEWQIRAAHLWQSAGDVRKAVFHLQIAAEQDQQYPDLQYRIGSAYLALGKSAEAILLLEEASSHEANRSDILETLAEAYHQAGNIEKSIKVAEQASAANPFTIKPLLLTGEIALEKGENSKALEIARKALTRDEQNVDAITFLAKVLLKKGDKAQALAALEKATAGEGATLDIMLKHAHLVREIKGVADSRAILENLVSKYPQNTELLKLLAESQWECGDKVAAEETARHSLRIDSAQPEMHGFLGKLKYEKGNLDQAIQHYSAQISLEKDQIDGYLNLARVYQQQREFHKALDTLQQAIDTNPQDIRAFLTAAGMLKDAKDYSSAEVMLRKAAAVDPKDVNIKRQLGAVIALNLVHKSQQESSQL